MEVQLWLKNGGQTPAYDVRCWYRPMFEVYPLPKPTPRAPADLIISTGIIPPQDCHIVVTANIKPPGLIKQGIETGQCAFYVYGEAEYKDIFNEIHTLEFCMLYGGSEPLKTTLDTNGVKIG